MKVKRKINKKQYILFVLLFICVIALFLLMHSAHIEFKSSYATYKTAQKDYMYLSDIPYIREQSNVGWGNITLDANLDASKNSGLISLLVNGNPKTFFKGVTAHATSTVVFDISEYDYDYFSTYYGVDAGRGTLSDGVKFLIYTSVDGQNWDLETAASPPIKKGNTEAEHLNISVKNKKYIKLYCQQYGNANSDHCTYGDAKLYKEGYVEGEQSSVDFIKPVDQYDEIIKTFPTTDLSEDQELVLLQRTLVNNIGYDLFQGFTTLNEENKEAISYLMTDFHTLKMYIMGGKPAGSYLKSLKEWVRLYHNYHTDWDIKEVSKYGNVIGEVYRKMAVSLSLTHSAQVALWMQASHPSNQSDSVTRYAIFKRLYREGKLKVTDSIDITEWFETYEVEEMRFVMNNLIDDESIFWLHDYTQSRIDANPNSAWGLLTPHSYIAYIWPNYANPVFHDPTKKDYWDELYNGIFSRYGVTYSSENDMVYKVWMNFRTEFNTGAVCGGISKTGSNIRTVHGIPASVIGQPGHAAIIYYTKNSEGQGYWGIDNNVSGWTLSEKSERMLLGWGNDRGYVRGYNVPYIVMAQEAINRFDEYQKSAEFVMRANAYTDTSEKETYLRKAIDTLNFNVDAWWELIKLYNNDETKKEKDYFQLAKELGEALTPFPLPMKNLLDQIKVKFTSVEYQFKYSLLETKLLNEAKDYTSTDVVLQPAITRVEAAYLLGQTDTSLASFSFDGEDANKIVLSTRFDDSGIRWDYSLDGKNTWNEVSFIANEEHKLRLTREQIESISAENDIYVHIVGVDYDEENVFKIDILDNVISEASYFRNDLENRIMGIDLTHQWRNSEDDPWTSYATASPDNTGNKTLMIRIAPTGTRLASNVLTFNFTEDNQPNTRKYIPVSHLSVVAFSSEAASHQGSAIYAIDGNYNTRWHSAWNGSDTQRFITIKLDQPMYVSAVEFVPAGGGNGKIYDGTIWGSMDGENFEILVNQENLRYTNQANTNDDAIANTKSFEIENPKMVQYVKIVADRSNGNWFTARAFNFYQDFTADPRPRASIGFDIKTPTNKNVTARLINPSSPIRITNNNGSDTYVFSENGEFTFEFINDENGEVGSATANVTWIDKEAPSATVEYNIRSLTNQDVIAMLVPNEEVRVLNNGSYDSENENADPLSFVFLENGEFTFEFVDLAGNRGSAVARVDWIDKTVPYAFLTYSETNVTNQDVTVTVEFDKEGVRILNNDGKNTYTFTENGDFTFSFVDLAGNLRTKTASVNWIDKVAPNATITYSPSTRTDGPVTATISSDENITITNNNGKNTYVFYENGSFDFTYVDYLGNQGRAIANVDWIGVDQPDSPTENPSNGGHSGSDNSSNNQGGSSNRPNTGADGQGSSNNNQTNDSNENQSGEVDNKYKTYTLPHIKVTMPMNNVVDGLTLTRNQFIVSADMKKRFGNTSEFIELYFKNTNQERVSLTTKYRIRFELDDENKFLGLYEIKANQSVQSLRYKMVNSETIEFEADSLGKYVIHYEDPEKDNDAVIAKENNDQTLYIIAGSILLIAIIVLIISIKRARRQSENKIEII